jgi:hypothetical protein
MATSSTGAQYPICAYVGRKPIAVVPMPIISSVATKTGLRP